MAIQECPSGAARLPLTPLEKLTTLLPFDPPGLNDGCDMNKLAGTVGRDGCSAASGAGSPRPCRASQFPSRVHEEAASVPDCLRLIHYQYCARPAERRDSVVLAPPFPLTATSWGCHGLLEPRNVVSRGLFAPSQVCCSSPADLRGTRQMLIVSNITGRQAANLPPCWRSSRPRRRFCCSSASWSSSQPGCSSRKRISACHSRFLLAHGRCPSLGTRSIFQRATWGASSAVSQRSTVSRPPHACVLRPPI